MVTKKIWRKGWIDKQSSPNCVFRLSFYYKRTRRTWRRSQSENTHRFTQNDTKKNTKLEKARPRWNICFLIQEIHIRSRQTSTRNEQMLTRRTLIQKDPSKGTAPNNYRPITCLPMMWKILTAQIKEKIYNSLTSRGLFPDEQKWCH